MSVLGKRVGDELYVHVTSLDLLPEVLRLRLMAAHQILPDEAQSQINVVKIHRGEEHFSFLQYRDFFDVPFPVLERSWCVQKGAAAPSLRTYSQSLNPPILHRKELLLPPDDPRRHACAELTRTAESIGLFDDTSTIGFLLNWNRLIAAKGYRLCDGQLVPLGNDTDDPAPLLSWEWGDDIPVARHLTALNRSSLSAPVQMLLRRAVLDASWSFFDYGCGRGDDMNGLRAEGFVVGGWDPHYAPDNDVAEADVVNLGFVVNVIEDPAERVEALQRAFRLARKVMSVAVMLFSGDAPGRPYRDGFLTSRSTFQKYFSQGEFKDYLEQVLHEEAFLVAPGVAFVFADKDLEQRFLSGRYRRRGVAARLLAARALRPRISPPREQRVRRLGKAEQLLEASRPVLDRLWASTLDLGRHPERNEVANLADIESHVGSLASAVRLLTQHYDQTLLQAAATSRTDDLRLYFALQQFAKRPAYRQLEVRVQLDVKAFFGDYRAAQAAGLKLLMDSAEPENLLKACRHAAIEGLGWLESDHSLQLHASLIERLPTVLRAYVACGLMLYGELGNVDLVKIHIGSGKLTLLEFEDFRSSPLPRLSKRVKVNIRRLDYDVFEYGNPAFPKPLLYHKSRFLNEDCPGFAEQLAFDEQLDSTGLLDESEFGPSEVALHSTLQLQRLDIEDGRLVRSKRLPDLDEACGSHFTYRDFVECGETQRRLGITNIPLNPETYNALHDLATQVLDPVIDYFGAIRLTYGFCSAELATQVATGIAPRLDQHAACEMNARGNRVCSRHGAACDFVVEDEDMMSVVTWIRDNVPFDRLYFYGKKRPIHVSFGPEHSRAIFEMRDTPSGHRLPTPLRR